MAAIGHMPHSSGAHQTRYLPPQSLRSYRSPAQAAHTHTHPGALHGTVNLWPFHLAPTDSNLFWSESQAWRVMPSIRSSFAPYYHVLEPLGSPGAPSSAQIISAPPLTELQRSDMYWNPLLSQNPLAVNLQQVTALPSYHGPPRRPIQSKHALWVGNIPSHTPILALRDHFFAPETAKDILSVVFTPASNSGFINFRSEEACRTSMRRFNKSFLYGVPLNCRSRKPHILSSSTSHSATSSINVAAKDFDNSPSIIASPVSSMASLPVGSETLERTIPVSDNVEHVPPDQHIVDQPVDAAVQELQRLNISSNESAPNRYFIMKSLTIDDLQNSVVTGRWSTQRHNEQMLDDAFKTGCSVYLIFSVNRSREYFGYAQMTSTTDYAAAPIVSSSTMHHHAPPRQITSKPSIIRTPALGHIPVGRIIDEAFRGKIFWEVEQFETPVSSPSTEMTPSSSLDGLQRSFSVEWIKLHRVPFRQTMHLRNSLNENKEVKIARDGTELDADAGRRLCSLFHLA